MSGEVGRHRHLQHDPQNYLVCPDQPWLDGINSGHDSVRQFVAMPLGLGYPLEAEMTGKEHVGGLQIMVFAPKPGRFPETAPVNVNRDLVVHFVSPYQVLVDSLGAPF